MHSPNGCLILHRAQSTTLLLCAGTSVESALVDESQQLPLQLDGFRLSLSGPKQAQLVALELNLTGPLFDGVPAREHLLGLFAWATAAVERCYVPCPFELDVGIAGVINALPEVWLVPLSCLQGE